MTTCHNLAGLPFWKDTSFLLTNEVSRSLSLLNQIDMDQRDLWVSETILHLWSPVVTWAPHVPTPTLQLAAEEPPKVGVLGSHWQRLRCQAPQIAFWLWSRLEDRLQKEVVHKHCSPAWTDPAPIPFQLLGIASTPLCFQWGAMLWPCEHLHWHLPSKVLTSRTKGIHSWPWDCQISVFD